MVANMTKLIAVGAGIQAGAITYWRLSGEMNRAELCARLESAGLGKLRPRVISEEQALRRALASIQERRILIRPLGARGSWAIVQEHARGSELAYQELLRAHVNPMGILILDERANENTADMMRVANLRDAIRAAYAHALQTMAPLDVSGWLTRQAMPACDAVSLRDTGGVYFVPRDSVALLETIAGLVGAEHSIFRIPAMHSADAADAVLAAIEDEARAAVADVESWLDTTTEPGERARKARETDMAAVRAKLTRYEDLFGRRMSTIGSRLGMIRNRLAGISVTLDAAAEGRDTSGRVLELDDRQTPETTDEDDGRVRPLELD